MDDEVTHEAEQGFGGPLRIDASTPVAGADGGVAVTDAEDEAPVPPGNPGAPDTSAPKWTMPGATDGPVPPVTLAELRAIDLFDELDDEQLGEFLAVAKVREVPAGERLSEPDGVPIGVQLLLEGSAKAYRVEEDRTEPVGRHRAPTWMGAIAVLSDTPVGARMVAETSCRIALIHGEKFRKLAFRHREVHRRVMQAVAPVMSRISAIEQDRERLASLGTMAAGLAHELNNPAAAAQSTAAQLADTLEVITGAFGAFVEAGIERTDAEQMIALHREVSEAAEGRTALDGLDAADAEDALQDVLEDLGVPEPWVLAEELASAGVEEEWVRRVAAFAGPATGAALKWVAASLSARGLVAELQESTRRMSSLVGSVKSYAYLDRGDLVEVDLHEGLETTLAVLGHKLKGKGIAVVREYDRSLPKLTIHGSEMNQVWTNLLHNAIQALVTQHAEAGEATAGSRDGAAGGPGATGRENGHPTALKDAFAAAAETAKAGGTIGTITIRTRREESCAVVEIADDGPGIPADVRDRIFDAFFTTKEVGEGTGLGLATVRRIVADRHGGSITVDSSVTPPTGTTFAIRLAIPEGM